MADIFGTIVGAGANIALGALNNAWAEQQQEKARKQNYIYGEMAADNADRRTRALYNDFYSPAALLKQYQDAGLSPSIMFGGSPGQGGQSGAQGSGAAGLGTPFMPMSMLEGAQIANITAQTEKTKAETANIKEDTILKQTQEIWQTFLNDNKRMEIIVTTTNLADKKGQYISLYEIAKDCYSYDKFLDIVKSAKNEELNMAIGTEAGQKTMREIYLASNRFERDINVLAYEGGNANFNKNIIECLQKKGFEEQNAEVALKQLQAAAEVADLTAEQKSAWNNILEKMRKMNSTTADIVIVASMILNQAASHWKINTGK